MRCRNNSPRHRLADEDDAPAQSSGTSSRPKINDNEQPLITQKLRKRLQEGVDELKSATFVVDDSAILENTITTVESLLKDLRQSCSIENGLPLRQSPAKKKLKVTEVDYHKVKHKTLPKRRRHSKRRKDKGVVDLTRDEGNSKDSAVESEGVGIIRCFLTTIERTVYVNV